jgi:O-antigen/teichoic acid export membrane protein
LAGLVLPPLALAGRAWQGVGLAQFDRGIFRQLVGYGLPLTLTVLCQFGLTTSDRLILGWQRGPEAAGLFAVGTDLATMTLGLVMLVVHLAAYPLAVQTLEREGRAAAARQLEHNTTAILAVALPVTALLIVLAPALAQLILGAAFQETAARLIPWIAVAALLAGVKSFYLDLSFHLGRNTLGQITVSLLAVTVSVGLNLLLIPRLGLMGAAYTSLTALTLASLASWYLGRRHFPLPFPRRDAGKLLLATCGMGGFLWALAPARQPFMLLAHVLLGGLVYGGLAVWLNVGGSRARCLAGLAARRRGRDGKCGSGHGRDGG